MSGEDVQFITLGEGARERRIAVIHAPPAEAGGTGILWLIGLRSDMRSTKATALADWAPTLGLGLTRFEYSGHGRSSGDLKTATIGDWLEETLAVFTTVTQGPQVVVGSSTGGYLALLLLRALRHRDSAAAARLRGLVLIAPAWDLTEDLMWAGMDAATRAELIDKGVIYRPSEYGDPLPITRTFIEEGRRHLFRAEPFDPGCPVVILQGGQDRDVPPEHTRRLAGFLSGDWVELVEIADGDHRLSRSQDIEAMCAAILRVAGAESRGG